MTIKDQRPQRGSIQMDPEANNRTYSIRTNISIQSKIKNEIKYRLGLNASKPI